MEKVANVFERPVEAFNANICALWDRYRALRGCVRSYKTPLPHPRRWLTIKQFDDDHPKNVDRMLERGTLGGEPE